MCARYHAVIAEVKNARRRFVETEMIELIFFMVAAGVGWCFALSRTARTKMPNPWWIKSAARTEADQKLMKDILLRVIGVVGGLIFSLLAVVVLVQKLR
jgi:hypothetical protein